MLVYLCDGCQKRIGRGQAVTVNTDAPYARFTFCARCGEPVTRFLARVQRLRRGAQTKRAIDELEAGGGEVRRGSTKEIFDEALRGRKKRRA